VTPLAPAASVLFSGYFVMVWGSGFVVTRIALEYAAPFTEAMLLGNLALRTGERIEWDAARMTVKNSAAAQALLTKHYRRGFELTVV
jgi:hypothetical protein